MEKKGNGSLDDSVEIVVAHYNEDLERVKPYAKNTIVYHKGSDDFPKIKCKKRIQLENVGRESHTYLYHIVNNYDNLSKYTLFFQGGINDHKADGLVYNSIDDYIHELQLYGFSCSKLCPLRRKNPQIEYSGKFKGMLESGSLVKSKLKFHQFYEKLLGKKQPWVLLLFYAANFGVSNNTIKKHSLSFYEKALSMIPSISNPEEGHYYERLWFSIFNGECSLYVIKKVLKFSFSRFIFSFKQFIKNHIIK